MIRHHHLYLAGTVASAAGWSTRHTAGLLTLPTELRSSELQILLHGAGHDHRYWNWPVQPDRYSYTEWAAAHGAATLAIDRIGTGSSSKPPGVENTVAAQARLLSQIVAQARAGLPGAPPFDRVVLVGHSMGSVVAGYEAVTYHDVDAVVLTGYIPVDGDPAVGNELFDAVFRPATEVQARLLGLVDDNYLMSRIDDTEALVFWPDQADPVIVGVERQLQNPTTRAELLDAIEAGPTIRGIPVPTLVLVGQHDALLIDQNKDKDCYDTVRRWAPATPDHFDFEVVADTGHNLNLHRTAHIAFETLDRWLAAHTSAPQTP
jgi:pimeloyl-ACP methyl ester carboxylesterase